MKGVAGDSSGLHSAYPSSTRVPTDSPSAPRRELVATGDPVRRRDVGPSDSLTGQESVIARLARDGHINQEIAAQLFISHRTVEWHMSKIFDKFEIRSRRGLRAALRAFT